jgi:hypothetical protein
MKLRLIIILGVISSFLASCGYDNFDAPGSKFEGKLVYKGEAINVSYNDVSFQLWEPGWQTKGQINVAVDQSGTFSSLLFNATYKLIIPSNQGPFRSLTNVETGSDTILVKVQGNKVMDIEVEPYYMIRTPQFTVSGGVVTGTFKAEKIITGTNAKNIERVAIYVNKTQFVDFRSNIATTVLAGSGIADPNTISLKATVPAMTPTQTYVFARIGLKVVGVEDMIFSPVVKINL